VTSCEQAQKGTIENSKLAACSINNFFDVLKIKVPPQVDPPAALEKVRPGLQQPAEIAIPIVQLFQGQVPGLYCFLSL
jgi:hypothetical protein